MKLSLTGMAMLIMAGPVLAVPSINVGALNEYIQSGKSTLGKRVSNTGSSTAYVRVTVDEIVFTNGNYTEKPLNSEHLVNGKGEGLISSPARMIIPAKGQQTNRLVFTGSREKEKYYRVRYIPVIPESGSEFGMNADEVKKYEAEISAGVTVLTGFGTVVTVLPESTRFDTRISEKDKKLTITNSGNASVVISSLKECSSNLRDCSESKTQQLRPGMQLERPLQQGKIWKYTLHEGSEKKAIVSGQHSN
ncbi:hypothetical protein [Pantoea dispersa]|uniref:hypothetical protein n=1 Tax=Pantoea dispersa TaxID=59814 RepID=UPI0013318D04|nr:hypothetical protein [Pantoea dispersa]KAF0855648.1 hypothetical protein Y788_11460 [Pantoea dispersa 625]